MWGGGGTSHIYRDSRRNSNLRNQLQVTVLSSVKLLIIETIFCSCFIMINIRHFYHPIQCVNNSFHIRIRLWYMGKSVYPGCIPILNDSLLYIRSNLDRDKNSWQIRAHPMFFFFNSRLIPRLTRGTPFLAQ